LLTPVTLVIQEAEIRKTAVQSQPRQIVHETLISKLPKIKRAQGVGPEFKTWYCKKKKKQKKLSLCPKMDYFGDGSMGC
jgi:hypothetical protein